MKGGLERSVTEINKHSFTIHLVHDFGIPGFLPREFVQKFMWRWENDYTLLVAYDSYASPTFPESSKYVRATATTLAKFEALEPIGEVPQSRLTWLQHPDMGGYIPKKAMASAATKQLMYASKLRSMFDRSVRVDALRRSDFERRVMLNDDELDDEESGIVAASLAEFLAISASTGKSLKVSARAKKLQLLQPRNRRR
jgi:hypothetical protein